MTDTKALRGLLEKADLSEWRYVEATDKCGPYVESVVVGDICDCYVMTKKGPSLHQGPYAGHNAELIAAMKNSFDGLLDAYEERDRLKALLEECHAFFGQMYEHGVNLPEAGEQHLERVSSYVALFLESEASND